MSARSTWSKRFIQSFAALMVTAAVHAPVIAQDLPEGITRGASVEGITEYTLDNGLRVLLFPDQSRQRTTVNITYLVGSRHEAYGETGMAHLLEHLVFKGTPGHPDIPQELTERGAFPNGTTWLDRTNYFETFPSTEENLAWALDLEADRMVNSFISAEDLESEMTVVRNEWEMGENSPQSVLMKRTMSAAFQWHNYGNSTIGARADIENVPIERLQGFYRKYYQPDNAVLVVAGRFDEATALNLIAEKFGAIPRPERTGANKLWGTYTAEPDQDGERTVTLRRVGDVQVVMAIYHMPPGSHGQFAAVDILSHILGNQPSGRLYKALVEPGLAANTSAFGFQLKEPGALITAAQVRTEDSLDEASEAMFAALGGFPDNPPTEEEVERARTDLLKDIDLSFRNTQSIALQLSEWAAMGDWRLFFIHRDRLKSVSTEEVARVAEAYLRPSNRTVGFFHPVPETPLRAEIPSPPDVEALVAGYAGGEAVAEGEVFDPTPANIEGRADRFELASGFEVAFLPKRNRGETVVATIQLRHGTEETLMGQATAGSLAGSMLRRGTMSRSRQEIEDELDRLNARVGIGGSATIATASISTTRENLPAVLSLVGEMLHEPSFDAAEFDLLRQQQLAGLENQRSEPIPQAVLAFQRYTSSWPEDHPMYTPTFDESIERLQAATVEQAREFWATFFGADGGTMSVVGDFEPAEIRPVIEEIFGDWTAQVRYERFGRPYEDVEPTEIDLETPDKANAVMIAGFAMPLRDDHPDYAALVLGNYILGGGFLNSRLATRIRQEEGLSYSVGSQFSSHPIDEVANFMAFAIYAPENADGVVEAFQEEMANALETGFTTEEVEAAINGYLEAEQNGRGSDNSLASQLAAGLFFNRTMEWTADLERRMSELTPEQINEAVKRHFDLSRVIIIRAGDFEGAKAAS